MSWITLIALAVWTWNGWILYRIAPTLDLKEVI